MRSRVVSENGRPTSCSPMCALTEREEAILRLVAGGYSNKEVARHLGMAVGHILTRGSSQRLRPVDPSSRFP